MRQSVPVTEMATPPQPSPIRSDARTEPTSSEGSELCGVANRLAEDHSARAVLLSAEGNAFCVGGDMTAYTADLMEASANIDGVLAKDHRSRLRYRVDGLTPSARAAAGRLPPARTIASSIAIFSISSSVNPTSVARSIDGVAWSKADLATAWDTDLPSGGSMTVGPFPITTDRRMTF